MVHLNGCLFTSYGICGDILTLMHHLLNFPVKAATKFVFYQRPVGPVYDENHEANKKMAND